MLWCMMTRGINNSKEQEDESRVLFEELSHKDASGEKIVLFFSRTLTL